MPALPSDNSITSALDQNLLSTGTSVPGISSSAPFSQAGASSALNLLNSSSLLNAPTTVGSSVSSLPNIIGGTAPPSMAPATQTAVSDFRVRISPVNQSFYGATTPTSPSGSAQGLFYPASAGAPNLLQPLTKTHGVLFPYSPQITFEQTVDYQVTNMIHTNMDYNVYQRTPSVTINITGKFTVQNQYEGQYAMAVIHFFRVASKMYFGTQAGANAGLPPPVLRLNGYGTYMFNNLNCILKSHSWSYDESVDTVPVSVAGGTVRLPSLFTMTVSLTVQQTPQKMRDVFNLDLFRTGALMQSGGWI